MNVLGIDIGATYIKAVTVSANTVRRLGTCRTPDDPDEVHTRLSTLLTSHVTRNGEHFDAVGAALAPNVSPAGIVRAWPNRQRYIGFNIHEALRRLVARLPICIDDCAAAAVAEHIALTNYISQPGATTLYVGIGTGVGAGAVIADRLHCGSTGSAFGLGHTRVPLARDILCRCGRRGCLQAVVSGVIVAKNAADAQLPPDTVATMARSGDRDAQRIIEAIVAPLTEGIAIVTGLLDPDYLVLGGGLAESGIFLYERINKGLRLLRVAQQVRGTTYGELSAAIGAAIVATTGLPCNLSEHRLPGTLTSFGDASERGIPHG